MTAGIKPVDRIAGHVVQYPSLARLHARRMNPRTEHVVVVAHHGAISGVGRCAKIVFDIENNLRTATDARDRAVMRYDYDMLSTRIHPSSMEAGERWVLNDVTGNTIYRFDT